ncbi:MAG: class I SAM-dependent methyltransferase, partial [Gemmatimonadota bacterium]
MPGNRSEAASRELRRQLGELDIYLFDQLLRGRLDAARRILDAGCGTGRNLVYFLRAGLEVHGVDRDPGAIMRARALGAEIAPRLPQENFVLGELDALPWEDRSMDAVLCCAVLHFASDESHFGRMLEEMWRVLDADGLFFARLASVIGLEVPVVLDENRRGSLPDGTERFLVDEDLLLRWSARLGATLLDPIKTTNVQNRRCMTTWVLRKP